MKCLNTEPPAVQSTYLPAQGVQALLHPLVLAVDLGKKKNSTPPVEPGPPAGAPAGGAAWGVPGRGFFEIFQ